MSDSEFTYMDFEEYSTSAFEESNENIDQIALTSAQALLNDYDENDDMDWSEVEPEDSDSYSNSFQINDDIDVEIERISMQGINLTACVIIDTIQGKIKCCNDMTNQWRLEQMVGTWKIDTDAVKDVKSNLHQLGVCYSHFLFDQNQLHDKGMKQSCSIEQNIIHFCFCIFCNKKKCFFSYGNSCKKHS